MKALKFLLVIALAGSAFGGGYLLRGRTHAADQGTRPVLYWVDPMHPAYTSDRPGIAPDCGMQLEPVYADNDAAAAHPATPRKVLYYTDDAAPSYRSERPGLNPETGNELTPVYADDPASMAAGTVRIDLERQRTIGIKLATVEVERTARELRTVGQVTFDETRVAHVHTRVEGWADHVMADFTGQVVRKGQPLLTMYSPEMLASQQELLLAARARSVMSASPLAASSDQAASLLAAARRRLQLWDMSDAQIEEVLRTGTPIRTITVNAPTGGYVMERNVFPNQKITPDTSLYTIVDLSKVWVLADVFETDAAAVALGTTASIALPYAGGAPLSARVTFVQPQVDPATRTLKVRMDVANPGMRLRPHMYVNVQLSVPQAERLTIPADAVLDTGSQQTVFLDRGNGYLEPRAVQIGERSGDRVAVLQGLAPGDRVVASGTFLVDSESQLRGMRARPTPHRSPAPGGNTPTTPLSAAAHAGHGND